MRLTNVLTQTKKLKYKTFTLTLLKWLLWSSIIGVVVGSTSAFLINVNDFLTEQREATSWFLYFLPLGGLLIGYMYKYHGKNATKGNDVILDRIHTGQGQVPLKMGPIVFISSFITHLFGGSTGREGAAIQMGGSISEAMNKLFKVSPEDQKILLISGISGGFGSAFGLPIAGTVFGMEVVGAGKMKFEALIPCFVTSFVGHYVTTAWGIEHEEHIIKHIPDLTPTILIKVLIVAVIFGLISILYSELKHYIQKYSIKYLKNPMLISFVGGLIIILLVLIVGSRDYTGRGLKMSIEAFDGTVPRFAFLAKLVFTAVTMGMGFRGGEVIPLFFMGATLGNSLAPIVNLPTSFLAGLGLIAVTAGAINTPIAFFIAAVEMFHGEGVEFFFIAVMVSYIFSSHHSIYSSQKIYEPKSRLFNLPDGESIIHLNLKKRV
jgi:H+/Cl- antiporter ClcA